MRMVHYYNINYLRESSKEMLEASIIVNTGTCLSLLYDLLCTLLL